MTGRRRLVWLLLATSLVGATTAHHHSILEDASAAHSDAPELAPRCQLAGGLSLHAVPRIVERDVCWACHWSRHLAPPRGSVPAETLSTGLRIDARPAFESADLARIASPPRGPPAPPSL